MPRNTLASRTINLNFVNLLACIQLASDWLKNNQLLSELTHAHYREPVPLKYKQHNKQTLKLNGYFKSEVTYHNSLGYGHSIVRENVPS